MTLREVIANSFGQNIEPDEKTISNNINNIEDLKKDLSPDKQNQLEAIAAELKAHQKAALQKKDDEQKQKMQIKQPQGQQENTAQVNTNLETAQVSNTGKTAQVGI